MKVCGIIAEYNPFHEGHKYQIEQVKKDHDLVIVCMSGNFVQRGEPAIINKWKRAETAIKNGADIVIELPYIYCLQSASHFAQGAVELLKLAKIDTLCFGSEIGNLENLQEIAETSISVDNLKEVMKEGYSYPEAYSLLTSSMGPNDILGVAYLKSLQGTTIQPKVIKRTNDYLSTNLTNPSALAIRNAHKHNEDITNYTPLANEIMHRTTPYLSDYYPYLRTLLLTLSPEYLTNLFLFDEGIENLMIKAAKTCNTFDEFMNLCTTRRYTTSRIRRCLCHLLTQVTKEEKKHQTPLDTLRILAFNQKGREYLSYLQDEEVAIASRFAKVPYWYRQLEYRSTCVYTANLPAEERKEIIEKEIGGPIVL